MENKIFPEKSEFLFYTTEDGKTWVEVRLLDETVWLTQKVISELFQKDVRTINEHINNIFEDRELIPDSVIRKFRITATDGKNYLNGVVELFSKKTLALIKQRYPFYTK